jgi:HK97 family phage major capsid protein
MPKSAADLVKEYQAIYERVDREGRRPTREENERVQDLLEQAQEQKSIEDTLDRMGTSFSTVWQGRGHADGLLESGSFGDGPGDRFVQSAGWKSISDPSSRATTWTTGPVEVSPVPLQLKAGTILESGQGAGLTPVPQVIPGVVEKLFEPLSVVDLIPSSVATTSSIRYVNEGTATNAAAGVAEGGTKPASELAYSTVDEPVKKIATVLTVSDELLEDAVQIQQYLNSRLRLFVKLEEEEQVLRGGGTDALVGLFGRAINTYNIGSDTPAVGIYKAIINTRGSANLAPSGIVMHPVNYASIRRGTATTGEYLAGYPIGPSSGTPGIYQDNVWGLPVALSTTVGLGTALVGAFNSAAHIYRRGGVSVEATNSHASYFTSNLVALRAEQRQALACFRPTAFTAVTGLGTSI